MKKFILAFALFIPTSAALANESKCRDPMDEHVVATLISDGNSYQIIQNDIAALKGKPVSVSKLSGDSVQTYSNDTYIRLEIGNNRINFAGGGWASRLYQDPRDLEDKGRKVVCEQAL